MHILLRSFFALTCLLIGSTILTHTAHALQAGDIDPSFLRCAGGADDSVNTITSNPTARSSSAELSQNITAPQSTVSPASTPTVHST